MPNKHSLSYRDARRSRPMPLAPVIALAILAVGIAYAQQNLPVPPAASTPASAPATAPEAKAAEEKAASAPGAGDKATTAPAAEEKSTPPTPETEENSAAPAPTQPAAARGSPQRFEPTEKVRADFDVAFPVDI